ncbi:MAG: hypothetical protein ABH879_07845 [archaeon]
MKKKNIYNYKWLFIAALASLLVLIAVINVINREYIAIDIADKCGQFMNLMSHTIPTEKSCEMRCRDQCNAKNYELKDYDFTLNPAGCNSCSCKCLG